MTSDCAPTRAEILALAVSTFGNETKAMHWLNTPKRRFDGRIPLDMLQDKLGRSEILEMLVQLRDGYSF